MKIIELDKQYLTAVKQLNNAITAGLENNAYYIPFSDNEIELLLTTGKGSLYGVLVDGKLAAVSGLLFNIDAFQNDFTELGIAMGDIAEIGGCMTSPDFRNRGYMYQLNQKLIELAKKRDLKYVFATAHPNNIASNKSLQKLDMTFIKEISRTDKLRNLYIKKL